MDKHPLSLMSIWVLIALSSGLCHVYWLDGRIHGASMSYVITPAGLRALRYEQTTLTLAAEGINRVLAQLIIERGVVGMRGFLGMAES
jgi:hypothetical protein